MSRSLTSCVVELGMERLSIIKSYIIQIFKSVWGIVGVAVSVAGLVGSIWGSLGNPIFNWPLWIWVIALTIGLLLAPYQLYKRQVKDIEGLSQPTAKRNFNQLGALIEEGRKLKASSVSREGKALTRAAVASWEARVREYLETKLDSLHARKWEATIKQGDYQPTGTTMKIHQYNRLKAGIEYLEVLQDQIRDD